MIKVHNFEDFMERVSLVGTVAVTTAFDTVIVPWTGYLKAIRAKVSVAGIQGTGSPTTIPTVNIKKNGSNMFDNATPLTLATTATEFTYDPELAGLVQVAKGDVLEFDVTLLFNGTSPTQPIGLAIEFVISKRPPLGGLQVGDVAPQDN